MFPSLPPTGHDITKPNNDDCWGQIPANPHTFGWFGPPYIGSCHHTHREVHLPMRFDEETLPVCLTHRAIHGTIRKLRRVATVPWKDNRLSDEDDAWIIVRIMTRIINQMSGTAKVPSHILSYAITSIITGHSVWSCDIITCACHHRRLRRHHHCRQS